MTFLLTLAGLAEVIPPLARINQQEIARPASRAEISERYWRIAGFPLGGGMARRLPVLHPEAPFILSRTAAKLVRQWRFKTI